MRSLYFALILLFSSTSLSQVVDPLMGWELEWTDKEVSSAEYGELSAQANDVNDAARERWYRELKKAAKESRNPKDSYKLSEIKDWVSWFNGEEVLWSYEVASYRVTYPDGFWFQLSYDTGVVEVQLCPSTLKQLKKNKDRLQKDLFNTALKAGLQPSARGEETHLHTGVQSAYGLDLKLIRNDLVSLINHPEFPLLFAVNLSNAPPLALMPAAQYAEFMRIIGEVDSGEIEDLKEFVKAVRKRVYHTTYDADMGNEFDPVEKFHQANIERMKKKVKDKDKTREHRSLPMPQNAGELITLSALEHGHVMYIRAQKDPIKVKPRNPKPSEKQQLADIAEYIDQANDHLASEDRITPEAFAPFLKTKGQQKTFLSLPRASSKGGSCKRPNKV